MGFKSFADPSEAPIAPGLTGIVGPNGCGKSNLLEALRWAMGAASARAMRGGEMDDLIFSGSGVRPQREYAEVSLVLDNSDRSAPAEFNEADEIEVRRSLRRGAGSSYRINGRLVRARDIQLLFADAATGANSPSLVRQGQVSELIEAKAQNRRRILEEAAGLGGLAARRREAELKLDHAEANLQTLGDVMAEIDRQLMTLRRQAVRARRYAELSARIIKTETLLFRVRLRSAASESAEAARELEEARLRETRLRQGAAEMAARDAEAQAALEPLRQAEAELAGRVGAVRMSIARLESEKSRLNERLQRAEADESRLQGDIAVQSTLASQARHRYEEISLEADALAPAVAEMDDAILQGLIAAADTARDERRRLETEADAASAALSRKTAEARAAQTALDHERQRGEALRAALEAASSESDRLSSASAQREALEALGRRLEALRTNEERAVREREAAEHELRRSQVAVRERQAELEELRRTHDAVASEAAGLERLVASAPSGSGVAPEVDAGALSRAIASALDDDLFAPSAADKPVYWSGRAATPLPDLPPGAPALSVAVNAPAALLPRLSQIGLVSAAQAEALLPQLRPGQQLVTQEGDMWRWDGFVRRADAPSQAAERLSQMERLRKARRDLSDCGPLLERAERVHQEALEQEAAALRRVDDRRSESEAAIRAHLALVSEQSRAEQEMLAVELRRETAQERVRRLERELAETAGRIADLEAAAGIGVSDIEREAAARRIQEVSEAREREQTSLSEMRARRDARERAASHRDRLSRDGADCLARAAAAEEAAQAARMRLEETTELRRSAIAAVKSAEDELRTLGEEAFMAERARSEAADALLSALASAKRSDGDARRARDEVAQAREDVIRSEARLEAAERRRGEIEAAAPRHRLSDDDGAPPERGQQSVEDIESALAALLRERDALGGVNMEAEQQLQEMSEGQASRQTHYEDLRAAVAKLREAISRINAEGRDRLLRAFNAVDAHFRSLFQTLFEGGEAELRLTDSEDPFEAGLEIFACPPGKRMGTLSLMSGGEQALTATALIFAVFLSRPAPLCVLDEVDAPLDDANVDRFCRLLDEMRRRTATRFLVITHNAVTMSRMDRLYGVTMQERGVSQLVSVDLRTAERMTAA
jgi:chromosome segregation protein